MWAIDHNPAPLASLDATTPALTPRTVDVADSSAVAALAAEIGGPEAARAAFVTRQSMGHLGRPEEIAAIVLHPASEDSDHTTGSVLITDGGMTL